MMVINNRIIMESFITFGGVHLRSTDPMYLENLYQIKIKNESEEVLPVAFPNINQSLCSCDKHKMKTTIDSFKVVEGSDHEICVICRNVRTIPHEHCSEIDQCRVIESVNCDHQFHYCCIKKWLETKTICPLCTKEWTYLDNTDTTITVYYGDKCIQFPLVDKIDHLYQLIADQLEIDVSKYKLVRNGAFVDEVKSGVYSLCTPDMHTGFNSLELYFNLDRKEKVFLKYSTTLKEMRQTVSRLYQIFVDQVVLFYDGIKLSRDFDHLNIFNLNIQNGKIISVRNAISIGYTVNVDDNNFVVLYPECSDTDDTIYGLIAGRVSWIPYPYVPVTPSRDLSCLLSSLYILTKKVNSDENAIKFVMEKLKKYAEFYEIHPIQTELAVYSLEALLRMKKFSDRNRMILSYTFHELITKMQTESGITSINPLLESNVLCNLLLSLNPPEKINWKFARKNVQIEKTFNVYSPLVLTNGVPPLLTLNEDLQIVVYVGKGKDVSLPLTLYDSLKNDEINVDGAKLGKVVADGDAILIDDRVYDEGIMVCIDTSNSMGKCSDFQEDLLMKQKDIEEDEKKFFQILEIEVIKHPQPEDIRQLINCAIWFVTHPNFNDWYASCESYFQGANLIKNIICTEQNEDKHSYALLISKYRNLFLDLLSNKTVQIGTKKISHVRTHLVMEKPYKPLPEYICPISHEIMINPVIAEDGFSYERENIERWLKTNSISPMTGEKIGNILIANKTLRIIINDWKEKQVQSEISDLILPEDTIKIHLPCPWLDIVYYYQKGDIVWDIIYEVYQKTGYAHTDFTVRKNLFPLEPPTELNKLTNNEITITLNKKENIKISINGGINIKKYEFPSTYSVKNIIYKLVKDEHYLYELWYGLKDSGDGFSTGNKLTMNSKEWVDASSEFYLNKKSSCGKSKNYLSRLDVVKKLFDSFINRSIAYSFNTAIGLMSFGNDHQMECEMTPFYESFRDKMGDLDTKGATALYAALKMAAKKLVQWRGADIEKRGNAKLRIICLSDGKDTGMPSTFSEAQALFMKHHIILDCIVIGSEHDEKMGKLCTMTNGYMFNPSSIKYALDIMEMETMITSRDRDRITSARSIYRKENGIFDEKKLPPIIRPSSLGDKSVPLTEIETRIADVSKRLNKELMELLKNPHPFMDVYINDDDLYFWKIVVVGPEGTPYQNGTWLAYVQFSQTYPSVPPNIRFVTPIKHCNINSYGRVCHSILDRNYTPSTKMSTILNCIYGLLLNPDVTDPLDTNLASLFYEANGSYEAQIMEYVDRHARQTREIWREQLI